MDRTEFDLAVQTSLTNTLKSLGDASMASVLSLLGGSPEVSPSNLISRLAEIDVVLDEVFAKFSKIIKHITILDACSRLRLDPPKLGNSLLWMVEELRSGLWKART